VSLEREFLDHLPVIDQVVQFIGRRHRLDPGAIEELQSAIHLKIIDNDYEVLRKFEGAAACARISRPSSSGLFSTAGPPCGGGGVRVPVRDVPAPRANQTREKAEGRRQKGKSSFCLLPFALTLVFMS
jgi:hypothetical protein